MEGWGAAHPHPAQNAVLGNAWKRGVWGAASRREARPRAAVGERRRGESRFTLISLYYTLHHRHANRSQSCRAQLTQDPRSRLQPKRAGPTPRPLRGAPGPAPRPPELAATLCSAPGCRAAKPTASQLGAQLPAQLESSASAPPLPARQSQPSTAPARPIPRCPSPPPPSLLSDQSQTADLVAPPPESGVAQVLRGATRAGRGVCGGCKQLCTFIKGFHTYVLM